MFSFGGRHNKKVSAGDYGVCSESCRLSHPDKIRVMLVECHWKVNIIQNIRMLSFLNHEGLKKPENKQKKKRRYWIKVIQVDQGEIKRNFSQLLKTRPNYRNCLLLIIWLNIQIKIAFKTSVWEEGK